MSVFERFSAMLREGEKGIGITIDEKWMQPLYNHWLRLLEWNARINLTAITEMEAAVARHYLDSLALVPHLESYSELLDVGTGAGFPGIVAAIARPELQVGVCEAVTKKTHFLLTIRRILELKHVEVLPRRLEELPTDRKYEAITSRAVADSARFLPMAAPYLKPGGTVFIFATCEEPDGAEGFMQHSARRYDLPGNIGPRWIIEFRSEN